MTLYARALLVLAPLLALLFWVAAGLLWWQGRRARDLGRRLGSLMWAVHAAIYWTVNAGLRIGWDYSTPTILISAWGSVLMVHAGVALLLMAWVLLKYESRHGE